MSDWQLKSDVEDIREEVSEIKGALLGKGYYDEGLKSEIEDPKKAVEKVDGCQCNMGIIHNIDRHVVDACNQTDSLESTVGLHTMLLVVIGLISLANLFRRR